MNERRLGSAASELANWLRSEQPEEEAQALTVHHDSPLDFVSEPTVSPGEASSLYPPGHEPKPNDDASGTLTVPEVKPNLLDRVRSFFKRTNNADIVAQGLVHKGPLQWSGHGTLGKGLLTNEGQLYTWDVNDHKEPHHGEIYQRLTGQPLQESEFVKHQLPFNINEIGQIDHSWREDGGLTPEQVSQVRSFDPRLKPAGAPQGGGFGHARGVMDQLANQDDSWYTTAHGYQHGTDHNSSSTRDQESGRGVIRRDHGAVGGGHGDDDAEDLGSSPSRQRRHSGVHQSLSGRGVHARRSNPGDGSLSERAWGRRRFLAWDDDTHPEDLDAYLETQKELTPWTRGNHGKYLVDRTGGFHHWWTNQAGEPHHDDAAQRLGVRPALKGDITPAGAYLDPEIVDPRLDREDIDTLRDTLAEARAIGAFPARGFHLGKVNEFHVALEIPASAADEIREWVDAQDWPEGTEKEDKSDYHITLLYSEDGYAEHKDADWLRHIDGVDIEVTGVDEFGEGDEVATVLRIEAPEAQEHAIDLQALAENHGIEINRFPGGYKPHLTVAYGSGKPKYIRTPKLKFRSKPSAVSTPRTSALTPVDPSYCSSCGQPTMTEPHQVSTKWLQRCTNCGQTRDVPKSHPAVKDIQNAYPPYPALLDEIGTDHPYWHWTGHTACGHMFPCNCPDVGTTTGGWYTASGHLGWHYNPFTGDRCDCPYGKRKKDGHHHTSSDSVNLRRVKKQNQKVFRTPEGQRYLDAINHAYDSTPDIEGIVPWLAARYKRGEFTLNSKNLEDPNIYYYHRDSPLKSMVIGPAEAVEKAAPQEIAQELLSKQVNAEGEFSSPGHFNRLTLHLPEIAKWWNARQHPSRRGFEITQHPPSEVMARVQEFKRDQREKEEKQRWVDEYGHTTQPAHTWNDGWSVHQLGSYHSTAGESEAMGHCVGDSDSQPYANAIADGEIEAFSLRDPDGYPHATWHYNPDGSLAMVQGRSGPPKAEYRDLISDFNSRHDRPDEEVGEYPLEPPYDQEINLPEPATIDDYRSQYHPDRGDEQDEWARDIGNMGENTVVNSGHPNWDGIQEDLPNATPEVRNDLYNTVLWSSPSPDSFQHRSGLSHSRDFEEELNANQQADPEQYNPIAEEWEQAKNQCYGPDGKWETPSSEWDSSLGRTVWKTVGDKMQPPLFQPRVEPVPPGGSGWGMRVKTPDEARQYHYPNPEDPYQYWPEYAEQWGQTSKMAGKHAKTPYVPDISQPGTLYTQANGDGSLTQTDISSMSGWFASAEHWAYDEPTAEPPEGYNKCGICGDDMGSGMCGYETLPNGETINTCMKCAMERNPQPIQHPNLGFEILPLGPQRNDPRWSHVQDTCPECGQPADHTRGSQFVGQCGHSWDKLPVEQFAQELNALPQTEHPTENWVPEGWDAQEPYDKLGSRCPMCKHPALIPLNQENTQIQCPECGWKGERAPDHLGKAKLTNESVINRHQEQMIEEHLAGLTTPQYQRQMADLDEKFGPDDSPIVHQWDDGWHVAQLHSPRAIGRTGVLMNNCWAQHGMSDGRPTPVPSRYALRDPDGIPRVAFELKPVHSSGYAIPQEFVGYKALRNPLGHGNADPSEERLQRVDEFAAAQPDVGRWVGNDFWPINSQQDVAQPLFTGGTGSLPSSIRQADTQDGQNPYYDQQTQQYWMICPTCNGNDHDCPACHGNGIEPVPNPASETGMDQPPHDHWNQKDWIEEELKDQQYPWGDHLTPRHGDSAFSPAIDMYHYAPRSVRDQIAQQGLMSLTDLGQADEAQLGGDADYVWLDERGPDHRTPDQDIWHVNAQQLQLGQHSLEHDPGEGGEPWWRTDHVPPRYLKRVEPRQKLGLAAWNMHEDVASNFDKIDAHDNSSGRGVQAKGPRTPLSVSSSSVSAVVQPASRSASRLVQPEDARTVVQPVVPPPHPALISRMSQDFTTGPHEIHHNPNDWGRGFVTTNGTVVTWPESRGTHSDMCNRFGVHPRDTDSFWINTSGEVYGGPSAPESRQQVEKLGLPEAGQQYTQDDTGSFTPSGEQQQWPWTSRERRRPFRSPNGYDAIGHQAGGNPSTPGAGVGPLGVPEDSPYDEVSFGRDSALHLGECANCGRRCAVDYVNDKPLCAQCAFYPETVRTSEWTYDDPFHGERDEADEFDQHGDFRIGDEWYDGTDGDLLPSRNGQREDSSWRPKSAQSAARNSMSAGRFRTASSAPRISNYETDPSGKRVWNFDNSDWSNYNPDENGQPGFNQLEAAVKQLISEIELPGQAGIEHQDMNKQDVILSLVMGVMGKSGKSPSEITSNDLHVAINNAIQYLGQGGGTPGTEGSPDLYQPGMTDQPRFTDEVAQQFPQWPDALTEKIPGWGEFPSGWWQPNYPARRRWSRTADYQGMTNWDTWHTVLMMDNEQETHDAVRQLVDQGAGPEQIRDWAITHILAPHNQQAIADAQRWNEIPEEERTDHHYDEFVNKHPEAQELIDGLTGGPDVSDTEPTLMDPEMVNWLEVLQHIQSDNEEGQEYEREDARLRGQGLNFAMPGHSDESNQMLDAWLKHHGVTHEDQRLPDGASAEFHTRMQVPIEHLPMDEGEYSPETYADWQNQGYGNPRVRAFGWSTLHDIQKGRANPWQQQTMESALAGQGYPPEQIQQITRQQRSWEPETNRWVELESRPAPPPDLSLDQPGAETFPEDWTRQSAMTLPQQLREWEQLRAQQTNGPQSQVVHTFPDGSTIQHHPTIGDVRSVGKMMRNFWQSPLTERPDDAPAMVEGMHQHHTLNDPNGLPQAAFFLKDLGGGSVPEVNDPLGPRNRPITPEQTNQILGWAGDNNYTPGWGLSRQASHGLMPCPDCGGDIKGNVNDTVPYRCSGCRRAFDNDQATALVPPGPKCPNCGSTATHSDDFAPGHQPGEMWRCLNCFHQWPVGSQVPDTYEDPDTPGDWTFPQEWLSSRLKVTPGLPGVFQIGRVSQSSDDERAPTGDARPSSSVAGPNTDKWTGQSYEDENEEQGPPQKFELDHRSASELVPGPFDPVGDAWKGFLGDHSQSEEEQGCHPGEVRDPSRDGRNSTRGVSTEWEYRDGDYEGEQDYANVGEKAQLQESSTPVGHLALQSMPAANEEFNRTANGVTKESRQENPWTYQDENSSGNGVEHIGGVVGPDPSQAGRNHKQERQPAANDSRHAPEGIEPIERPTLGIAGVVGHLALQNLESFGEDTFGPHEELPKAAGDEQYKYASYEEPHHPEGNDEEYEASVGRPNQTDQTGNNQKTAKPKGSYTSSPRDRMSFTDVVLGHSLPHVSPGVRDGCFGSEPDEDQYPEDAADHYGAEEQPYPDQTQNTRNVVRPNQSEQGHDSLNDTDDAHDPRGKDGNPDQPVLGLSTHAGQYSTKQGAFQPPESGRLTPTDNPYEPNTPEWSQWRKEAEQWQWDQPGDVQNRPEQHEWVPTEHLARMLEFDRNEHDPERVNEVGASLHRTGFNNPLWVDYNPDSGLAHLSEGNHRLTQAIQSGIPAVPVSVYRSSRVPKDQSILQPYHYRGMPPEHPDFIPDPDYVPQYMLPSWIGMPTTDPWQPESLTNEE